MLKGVDIEVECTDEIDDIPQRIDARFIKCTGEKFKIYL